MADTGGQAAAEASPEPRVVVFISYSHEDRELVLPVVQLLKTAMRPVVSLEAVFVDTDVQPGDEWRATIEQRLRLTEMLFVFWCGHAARSKEVRGEYELGIQVGARIVPVLLDETSLTGTLQNYQWVDLRKLVLHAQIELRTDADVDLGKDGPFTEEDFGALFVQNLLPDWSGLTQAEIAVRIEEMHNEMRETRRRKRARAVVAQFGWVFRPFLEREQGGL